MSAPVTIRRRTRSTAAADTVLTPVVSTVAGAIPAAAPILPSDTSLQLARPAARPVARSSDDYAVGYGKPPRGRPFAPGHSGNPNGRPKGSKNFHTLVEEALNETVAVREKGREQMISKRQVGALRLANKVAEGDPKVLAMLWKMSVDRGAKPDPAGRADQEAIATDGRSLDDADVIAELVAMALQGTALGTEA